MYSAINLKEVSLKLPTDAGNLPIIDQVSLRVPSGQSLALVGPSGAGKSSLLMLMAGLERPSSGQIHLLNEEVSAMDEDALAMFRGRNIGIVFQSFHLIPSMNALENTAVPLELAHHDDAVDRARDALERVGLAHRLNHLPAQLSGGEQQRVALARALAVRPKILFADEPTGNLDSANSQIVTEMIFALCQEAGTTLIMVTHDPALAAQCDRRVAMLDGRLAQQDMVNA